MRSAVTKKEYVLKSSQNKKGRKFKKTPFLVQLEKFSALGIYYRRRNHPRKDKLQ